MRLFNNASRDGHVLFKGKVRRINAAGGALSNAANGMSEDELKQAIKLGVAKVNIGTDGRLIWTRVHREFFRDKPHEFDFMAPGKVYMEEYAAFVAGKCEMLGAADKADEARSVPVKVAVKA